MALAEELARKRKMERAAPRLWVRRFVLYEHLGRDGEEPMVIRDQPLLRGLNIIQGIEAAELPPEARTKRGLTGQAIGAVVGFNQAVEKVMRTRMSLMSLILTAGTFPQGKLVSKGR